MMEKDKEKIMQFYDSADQEIEVTKWIIGRFEDSLNMLFVPRFLESLHNTFGTYEYLLEKKPEVILEITKQERITVNLAEGNATAQLYIKPIILKKCLQIFINHVTVRQICSYIFLKIISLRHLILLENRVSCFQGHLQGKFLQELKMCFPFQLYVRESIQV